MSDEDSTFEPLAAPLGSLMNRLSQHMSEETKAEVLANLAIQARRATGDIKYMQHAAAHLSRYETLAEQAQLWIKV